MRRILTTLFLDISLGVTAQDVKIQGPKRQPSNVSTKKTVNAKETQSQTKKKKKKKKTKKKKKENTLIPQKISSTAAMVSINMLKNVKTFSTIILGYDFPFLSFEIFTAPHSI